MVIATSQRVVTLERVACGRCGVARFSISAVNVQFARKHACFAFFALSLFLSFLSLVVLFARLDFVIFLLFFFGVRTELFFFFFFFDFFFFFFFFSA
jgi:hypothetical protein